MKIIKKKLLSYLFSNIHRIKKNHNPPNNLTMATLYNLNDWKEQFAVNLRSIGKHMAYTYQVGSVCIMHRPVGLICVQCVGLSLWYLRCTMFISMAFHAYVGQSWTFWLLLTERVRFYNVYSHNISLHIYILYEMDVLILF